VSALRFAPHHNGSEATNVLGFAPEVQDWKLAGNKVAYAAEPGSRTTYR
jgi:hypothetical protein